jgi:protein-tyrosine phosphatase
VTAPGISRIAREHDKKSRRENVEIIFSARVNVEMVEFYPAKQVVPRIWVGSMQDASSSDFMDQHRVGLIINCTKDVPAFFAGTIPTYRVPMDDHETSAPVLYGHAPTVAREMRRFLERTPGSILVHCAAGISRSSSMVASYLILEHGATVIESIRRIRGRKPETFQPRVVFVSALVRFQQERRAR